jgi:hypothetical protein
VAGWPPRGPYAGRRRGIELLLVGLAGLVLGCVLGAGVTAVAAHVIGDHRDGRFGDRGYGWYDRRGPHHNPGFPVRPAPPSPVPSPS